MCLNKKNIDDETLSFSVGLPSLSKFVTVVHRSYYSYKTEKTCSEPGSVECRLFFTFKVTTALGNWKHLLPMKIVFSARFQSLLL